MQGRPAFAGNGRITGERNERPTCVANPFPKWDGGRVMLRRILSTPTTWLEMGFSGVKGIWRYPGKREGVRSRGKLETGFGSLGGALGVAAFAVAVLISPSIASAQFDFKLSTLGPRTVVQGN